MWIPKKRIWAIEKRIADLEVQVQSQQDITEAGGYKVTTICPNSPYSLTAIEFQMPYHDWRILEASKEWKEFSKLLQEHQMQSIQMSHKQVKD